MRWLLRVDHAVTLTRPGWLWVGQLALVALGTHRGADHLDDLLLAALTASDLPWPDPELPLTLAAGCALTLELLALVLAVGWLALSVGQPATTAHEWLKHVSVRAVVAPIFWVATTLTGTWVVAIAAQDWLAIDQPMLPWAVAAVVTWRVGLPGCVRVARGLPPAKRSSGLFAAPVLLLLGGLAVRHGLPIWGWL